MNFFNLDPALIERYESFARSFSEIRALEIRAQVDAVYAEQRFWQEALTSIYPRYEAVTLVDKLVAQNVLDPTLLQPACIGSQLSFIVTKNKPSPKPTTVTALS